MHTNDWQPSVPDWISSSSCTDFASCRTKWWLKYCLRVGKDSELGKWHLIFGQHFARGMEVMRLHHQEHPEATPEELVAEACRVVDQEALDRGEAWVWDMDTRFKAGPAKSRASLELGWRTHLENWPMHQWRPKGVEVAFRLPLSHGLQYRGKLDLVAEVEGVEGPEMWGMDEKTASQLGDTFATKWMNHSQMTGYLWGMRQMGYTLRGMIMAGVGFRAGGKVDVLGVMVQHQDWELDQFGQMVRDMAGVMSSLGKSAVMEWQQHPFQIPIRGWRHDNCVGYSGCPYLGLCNAQDLERALDQGGWVQKTEREMEERYQGKGEEG